MQFNAASQPWDEVMQAMSLLHQGTEAEKHANHHEARLARAVSGCNHARAALLREIEDPCFRFCLAQLACQDAARDATQETALRVLRSLRRYRGDAAFTTWALSIALNVCREHRRRRRWLALPVNWTTADPSPSPSEQAGNTERQSQLMVLLGKLPPRQREAVTLRYLQGLDTRQTAQAMRCAEGTVKATLAKALTAMRQHWGDTDD
ncbi:MAG: sigma-70 family RNA polymerase sigma factor [Planctomycetota bacterium]